MPAGLIKRKMKQKTKNAVISAFAVLCMWAVWVAAYLIVNNEYVVPSFTDTAAAIWALLCSGRFWASFGMTALRVLLAWLASFALAAVCAALSAASGGFRRFVAPIVGVLRALPTMAFTLMLLIWTSPRVAPVIVALMMLFPLTYSQMTAAYSAVDGGLIEMAKVYGVSKKDRVMKIYLPQTLPPVLAQAGADFSLALKVMVSAEVIAGTYTSLGGMINEASMYLMVAEMFALTIAVLVFGGVCECALGKLTKITDRWNKGAA